MNFLASTAKYLGCIFLIFIANNQTLAAIAPNSTNDKPPSFSVGSSQCSYSFSDTYYKANTATPPSIGASGGNINNFGPELRLQFNNNNAGSSATPPVPCTGYYQVSFSIVLRNDNGVDCNTGLNNISTSVTSTDPSQPNVYGCPVIYPNFCCLYGYGSCCNWAPWDQGYGSPRVCTTTTVWSQCTWANNYNGGFWWDFQRTYWYYSTGYPIFTYTPYWGYSSYTGRFGPYYNGMCGYDYAGNQYTCQIYGSYQYVIHSPTEPYCAQRPLNFQTTVYLHKGATISPPSIWSQITYSIYKNYGGGSLQSCAMSVTGGQFKVFYLHP